MCCDIKDLHFVTNAIIPVLEHDHDPPFKLYIGQRDYLVGNTIIDNIARAIENSNSAIIIMSQAFLDNKWCMEEFMISYLKDMEDPAFKLFIIMMQPEHTLKNKCTNYFMTRKLDYYDYKLDRNDPRLFRKICKYLTEVKQPVIKGRTRLIIDFFCNSIVYGQINSGHKKRCAISEESISPISTSSSSGENTQNLDEVSLNETVSLVDVHAENRRDNKLSEESVSLISTKSSGGGNIKNLNEVSGNEAVSLVDVHAQNRRDYELLKEEREGLDRYYVKVQADSDISKSEMNEGPNKPNILTQTCIAEVEEYSVFEGENDSTKMTRVVSAGGQMKIDQKAINFVPRSSVDAIDQFIRVAVSGDSAGECLTCTTYLQMKVLDKPLSVESIKKENSKERIRATLRLIHHHEHEEHPKRKEYEIKKCNGVGLT